MEHNFQSKKENNFSNIPKGDTDLCLWWAMTVLTCKSLRSCKIFREDSMDCNAAWDVALSIKSSVSWHLGNDNVSIMGKSKIFG